MVSTLLCPADCRQQLKPKHCHTAQMKETWASGCRLLLRGLTQAKLLSHFASSRTWTRLSRSRLGSL